MEIVHIIVMLIGLMLGGFFIYGAWRFGDEGPHGRRASSVARPAARRTQMPKKARQGIHTAGDRNLAAAR